MNNRNVTIHYLLQVQLQTQQNVTHGLSGMAVHVVKQQGIFGLYKGLSASIMRQVSFQLVRVCDIEPFLLVTLAVQVRVIIDDCFSAHIFNHKIWII